mmetsp:Transcript_252/g.475  ORF Transcript_252/g.475 Transcript_252/m.475 type:complete len:135 (-) Transcript_252:134-538(-)
MSHWAGSRRSAVKVRPGMCCLKKCSCSTSAAQGRSPPLEAKLVGAPPLETVEFVFGFCTGTCSDPDCFGFGFDSCFCFDRSRPHVDFVVGFGSGTRSCSGSNGSGFGIGSGSRSDRLRPHVCFAGCGRSRPHEG